MALDAAYSFANLAAAFAFNFLIKSIALDFAGAAAAAAGAATLASALGASTTGAGSAFYSTSAYFGASTLASAAVASVFFLSSVFGPSLVTVKSNADASLVNKRRDDHIFQDKVVYVMEKETRMLQQIKELVSRYIR